MSMNLTSSHGSEELNAGQSLRSKVSIVRCAAYEPEAVEAALRRNLELIGGIESIVRPGNRVLLKVNLLSPRPPEQAVTTHPIVVGAMLRLVRAAGGRPVVGDSSGGLLAGQAQTEKALSVTGIRAAAAANGAELANFDAGRIAVVENSASSPVPVLHLAQSVLDADVVINMPKLKTHGATLFTGALKNMFGTVPGGRKAAYHRMAPTLNEFANLLVDIYAAVKPGLTVMDGVWSMEGNGPAHGRPRRAGLLLASTDGVALDTVAAAVIGLRPDDVATTRVAAARGIGEGDFAAIDIVGERLSEVRIPDFRLPPTAVLAVAPRFLLRGAFGMLRARPVVDPERCVRCWVCADNCPAGVIRRGGEIPVIDYHSCISCYCCQELCPQAAVTIRYDNRLVRWLAGRLGRID